MDITFFDPDVPVAVRPGQPKPHSWWRDVIRLLVRSAPRRHPNLGAISLHLQDDVGLPPILREQLRQGQARTDALGLHFRADRS